jgi:hypothetical protein
VAVAAIEDANMLPGGRSSGGAQKARKATVSSRHGPATYGSILTRRGKLEAFVDRMIDGWQRREITADIMLANNFTDAEWFQKALDACTGVPHLRPDLFRAPPWSCASGPMR